VEKIEVKKEKCWDEVIEFDPREENDRVRIDLSAAK
jgi:hypothetical protein